MRRRPRLSRPDHHQTPDVEARDSLRAAVREYAAQQPGVELFAKLIEVGPPVGKRCSTALRLSMKISLLAEKSLDNITIDTSEPVRIARRHRP